MCDGHRSLFQGGWGFLDQGIAGVWEGGSEGRGVGEEEDAKSRKKTTPHQRLLTIGCV